MVAKKNAMCYTKGMNKLRFYNTETRKKEEFKRVGKAKNAPVSVYSCGPTVYTYAHVGNLRAYIFVDVLVKVLRLNGFCVKHLINITDVGHLVSDSDEGEDKVIKAARESGKSALEITQYFTDVFLSDIDLLNISRPDYLPRATNYISEMKALVETLLDKGYAYEIKDAGLESGIYFDVSKYKNYGKLSGQKLEDKKSLSRDVLDVKGKRHPADFALWKAAPDNYLMKWDSKWGLGYPGWHIECSAMIHKLLGDTIDIHTGGIDHVPIHHENERAQSESFTGKPLARFWLHNEFLLADGSKMSKSLGNAPTLTELVNDPSLNIGKFTPIQMQTLAPMAFRLFCLQTHYRQKLNFTHKALTASAKAYLGLVDSVKKHYGGAFKVPKKSIDTYRASFVEALNDDLATPKVIALLFEVLKNQPSGEIYNLVQEFDKVLSLNLNIENANRLLEKGADKVEIPKDVIDLANDRLNARQNKDWALSDKLRAEINEKGYEILDSKDGYNLKPR
ncbi:MAG: cysteine--tRNA ligase [Firmicutes bacterium]|nr:cysteine--tRNA ligase [Bacillota bacterium]